MSSTDHLSELESLRAQVAELSRKLAERDRSMQDLRLCDLENIMETVPDMMFTLDTQGNMVKWNRRVGEVTGYSPEELLNMPALAFVPLEEQARTAAAIHRAFMEGYAELEGHLLTKERRLIPYHWTGAVRKNCHGESIGIIGIGRDVGDTKRAETAFLASEERYRALYDDTPTMYFTLAMDGTVRSVNRFGAMQLGYLAEELIGHSVLNLFHESDKEAVLASLSECLAKPETTRHWEFQKVRKDGNILWVRETARVGQSATGETVVLVTCEDVTERKQAERIVQHRLQFERLIASLSTHFINLSSSDFDVGINQALCSIGKFADVDRSYVFLFRNDGKTVDNTHEWCADGLVAQIDNLQGLPTDSFPWIMARHQRGAVTHLPRISDLPPEASAEKEEFEREGIQSRLTVPIVSSSGVIGFVGFDLVRIERTWDDDEIALVQIIGEMLANIIERMRAEKSLQTSQEKLRQALQASNTGLWDWNTDTNEVSFSREWKRQIGYEEADVTDAFESWEMRLHPDDHDRAIAFVRAYLARPVGDYHQEFRLRHKHGTYRWIEARASFVTEPDGRRVRLIGSHTDITERKRVEEALRLAKFSIDRAADAVYWINPQAKILSVNDAASLMLGYSTDELCAMTVHALNPDFQADMWPGFWAETQRRGTMVFETAHRAKNGRLIPIEVSVNYLQYEGKEYHCAFVRDITARKRAEEELQQSHAFLRHVLDSNPNFIFAKDREGRFTLANTMLADTYGVTVDELIGKTDADFNSNQKEVAHFRENDVAVMDSCQDLFIPEEMITDTAGNTRWVQTVKRPILDHEGHAIMVFGAATDITARKRIEETLRQREGDLRAALEERERISQDLHDGILQSLFAVGLTLEASKSTMTPTARKTSGPPLDQAIDQLNHVMHEIRNFIAGLGSDLLQGKDLSVALQHMLTSLTQNQPTRVRLAVEDRAAQAVSATQALHLFRVIQEAVSNCIRHGRAPEARVSLKMLKQGVRLSIRDNGRGFNPKAAEGTGYGLRNMAARARKIGGRFTVVSKANEGTRIVLDLPNEASDVRR